MSAWIVSRHIERRRALQVPSNAWVRVKCAHPSRACTWSAMIFTHKSGETVPGIVGRMKDLKEFRVPDWVDPEQVEVVQ